MSTPSHTLNDALVSVIVPIYNTEVYLTESIDSVLAQTHKRLEVVLVNDGSTDGCGAICDTYATKDTRIKVIHQTNAGVSAARNKGLDLATGDFIAFIDPDDYWDGKMVERCLKEFERNSNIDIVDTHRLDFSIDGSYRQVYPKKELRYELSGKEIWKERLVQWENIVDTVCHKLYRHKAIGSLRFQEGRRSEDYLFCMHLYAQKPNLTLCLIPDVLYYYRLGDSNSLSQSTQKGEKAVLRERMIEEGLEEIYTQLEQSQSPYLRYFLMEWILWTLDRFIYLGKVYRTEPDRHTEVAQRCANLTAHLTKARTLPAFDSLPLSLRFFAHHPRKFVSTYRWAIALSSRLGRNFDRWFKQRMVKD